MTFIFAVIRDKYIPISDGVFIAEAAFQSISN